jgi:DNA-binding NtrC family response regulator
MNPTRILLIEDSPSDALLVETILTHETTPFAVTRAGRLAEALGLLGEKTFDVILTDLGLPDSQALNTVQELHKGAPQLPLVVLTRNGDTETALEAIKMGAQDYLPKSHLDGFNLVRILHYAVERQRLTQQLIEAVENIKTLTGLLPICGFCKKIRDDHGYWNQLEAYISKRSRAMFSHGICPECYAQQLQALEVSSLEKPSASRAESAKLSHRAAP